MTTTSNPLRTRWLTAMRASTTRALGRECDYAMAEGDVDKFDPIGLLALCAGRAAQDIGEDVSEEYLFTAYRGEDGACVKRHHAELLAKQVGFPPDNLIALCEANDAGVSWADMADAVEEACARE